MASAQLSAAWFVIKISQDPTLSVPPVEKYSSAIRFPLNQSPRRRSSLSTDMLPPDGALKSLQGLLHQDSLYVPNPFYAMRLPDVCQYF
jgi:hypothetical protein